MIHRSSRSMSGSCWSAVLILTLGIASPAVAETDFYRDVFPILKANCLACHNKKTTEGNLNLETPESVVAGGDTGPAVVPGKASESLIHQAATQLGDVVMPPKNNKTGARPLTEKELAILAAWINEGAKTSVQKAETIKWHRIAAAIQPVYCVDITRDGHWGVAARANRLDLYNLSTRSMSGSLIDPAVQSLVPGIPPATHPGVVDSVAFSPDGTRIASGSYREVKIWHQTSNGQPQLIPGPATDLIATATTVQGDRLVCLDASQTLKVIKTADGSVTATIANVKPAGIPQLQVSPDGKQIAVLLEKSTIGRWLVESGAALPAVVVPAEPRRFLWTADSATLITLGADGKIRQWSVPTAADQAVKPVREFQTPASPAALLNIPGAADRIVTIGEDGQVRIWQLADGKLLSEFKSPASLTQAISANGKLLATAGADGVVHLWDLQTGKAVIDLRKTIESEAKIAAVSRLLAAHQLDVAFQKSQIANLAATNKSQEEVVKKAESTIETVKKGIPEKEKAVGDTKAPLEAAQKVVDALAPQLAAANGKPSPELDKQSKDLEQKLNEAKEKAMAATNALQKLQNHLKDATADLERAKVAIAANTKLTEAASASQKTSEEAVKQATADLEAAKAALAKGSTAKPVACQFTADSQIVSVILENGEFRAWAVASGDAVAQRSGDQPTSSAQWIVSAPQSLTAVRPNGTRLTCQFNPSWTLERVLGGGEVNSPISDRANALAFSPDGELLAVASGIPSRGGDISLWNVATGNLVQNWTEAHTDSVLSLSFNSDGTQLATGGADRLARIFNVSTGKQIGRFEGHTHHVQGLAFRSDNRLLATAGGDGSVIVWDLAIGERRNKVGGWTKEVTSIRYIGATAQLITGAGDPQVRIINDDGGQVRAITKLTSFVHAIAISDSGERILGGEDNGTVHLWNAADGAEIATFAP